VANPAQIDGSGKVSTPAKPLTMAPGDSTEAAHIKAGLETPTNIPKLARVGQAPEHRDNPMHPHQRVLPNGPDSKSPAPSAFAVDLSMAPAGTTDALRTVGVPPAEKKVVDPTAGKRPIPPWLS
jgi:hypothetical protein